MTRSRCGSRDGESLQRPSPHRTSAAREITSSCGGMVQPGSAYRQFDHPAYTRNDLPRVEQTPPVWLRGQDAAALRRPLIHAPWTRPEPGKRPHPRKDRQTRHGPITRPVRDYNRTIPDLTHRESCPATHTCSQDARGPFASTKLWRSTWLHTTCPPASAPAFILGEACASTVQGLRPVRKSGKLPARTTNPEYPFWKTAARGANPRHVDREGAKKCLIVTKSPATAARRGGDQAIERWARGRGLCLRHRPPDPGRASASPKAMACRARDLGL